MLIQKNDTTEKPVQLYPYGKLINPDTTFKSTGLFYNVVSLVGYDNSNYSDFEQPTIKSYVSDTITDKGTIFNVGTSITVDQFKEAEKIVILITDTSNVILSCPNSNVKIYLNLFDEDEMDNTSVPFTYLMQSLFEFSRVSRQLKSVHIKNETGSPIKAFLQVAKYNEGDTNYRSKIVL